MGAGGIPEVGGGWRKIGYGTKRIISLLFLLSSSSQCCDMDPPSLYVSLSSHVGSIPIITLTPSSIQMGGVQVTNSKSHVMIFVTSITFGLSISQEGG